MTDHLDPQFQAFSEMLDQEETLGESVPSLLGDDGRLLLELRRHLREGVESSALPRDFAASTATMVQERYFALPPLIRGLTAWEPVLRADPLSRAGLPWLFGVCSLGLAALAVSWTALGALGLLGLLSGVALTLLYRRYLPQALDLPLGGEDSEVVLAPPSKLFYLIPLLALAASAGYAGQALFNFSEMSLSMQAQGSNYVLAVGGGGALVVFAWLLNAFWPLWRSLEEASRGGALKTALVQGLHGLWLVATLFYLFDLIHPTRALLLDVGDLELALLAACLALTLGVIVRLSRRQRISVRRYPLRAACKRALGGFLVGLVPLMAMVVVSYQAILTREMAVRPQYETMVASVESWLVRNKALTPEENGAAELSAIFFAREKSDPATPIADRLKAGSVLLEPYESDPAVALEPARRKELEESRRSFLQELPRIEKALVKPHFSFMTGGELHFGTRVPNYILARAVSRGLEGLVRERLAAGDVDEALRYQALNMRWASRFREGSLIGLMIGISLNRIATESVERMLFEHRLSEAQLSALLGLLKETAFGRSDFHDTMLREVYSADTSLRGMAQGDPEVIDGVASELGRTLLRVVPRSYWRSERNVYMNLSLAHTDSWLELNQPETDLGQVLSSLPWSLATAVLIPNTTRAQAQFMVSLTHQNALQAEVALELYKKAHGAYPASLQELVPVYLDEVPIDVVSPNLWKRKSPLVYALEGDSYRLISESPVYEMVKLKTRQSFGDDGNYKSEY